MTRGTREVAIMEVWLNERAAYDKGVPYIRPRTLLEELGKAILWFLGLFIILWVLALLAPEAKADSVGIVAQDIIAGSVLPFVGGAPQSLARDVLAAQLAPIAASYAGPESLLLSIESVDRAIDVVYCCWLGSPAMVSPTLTPLVWAQAEIAINPNASITITPGSLNFGEVPIGQSKTLEVTVGNDPPTTTPEPEVWVSLLAGLVVGYFGTRRLRRV